MTTATAQHTPGPWHIRPDNGGRYTLLEQQTSDPSSGEARANACLIAAAPDSYDALRQFVHSVETDDVVEMDNACQAAKAAITKIEGRDHG